MKTKNESLQTKNKTAKAFHRFVFAQPKMLLAMMLIMVLTNVLAQQLPPIKEWQSSFPTLLHDNNGCNDGEDWYYNIIEVSASKGGGYLGVGYAEMTNCDNPNIAENIYHPASNGNTDWLETLKVYTPTIVRLDANGNRLWETLFPDTYPNGTGYFIDVVEVADGFVASGNRLQAQKVSYVFQGQSTTIVSSDNTNTLLIAKVDNNGVIASGFPKYFGKQYLTGTSFTPTLPAAHVLGFSTGAYCSIRSVPNANGGFIIGTSDQTNHKAALIRLNDNCELYTFPTTVFANGAGYVTWGTNITSAGGWMTARYFNDGTEGFVLAEATGIDPDYDIYVARTSLDGTSVIWNKTFDSNPGSGNFIGNGYVPLQATAYTGCSTTDYVDRATDMEILSGGTEAVINALCEKHTDCVDGNDFYGYPPTPNNPSKLLANDVLLKINLSNGNLVWCQTIGQTDGIDFNPTITLPLDNSGILVTTNDVYAISNTTPTLDGVSVHVYKTQNASGATAPAIDWNQSYTGIGYINCVFGSDATLDGGLVYGGNNELNDEDYHAVKLKDCPPTTANAGNPRIEIFTAHTSNLFTSPTQTWTPQSNPFGGTTFNPVNTVDIFDKLVIPAGYNITISGMTFRFKPRTGNGLSSVYGGKVIIENLDLSDNTYRGGILTLKDKTIFTSDDDCGDGMWEGIEVRGEETIDQTYTDHDANETYTYQGRLNLIGDAMPNTSSHITTTIKNAYIGALAGIRDYATGISPNCIGCNMPAFADKGGGGIITSEGAEFENNMYDVYFQPHNIGSNISYFKYTTFITDAPLVSCDNVLPKAHAYLNEIKDIRFKSCVFSNDNDAGHTPHTNYLQTMYIGSGNAAVLRSNYETLIGIQAYQSQFKCVPAVATGCIFKNLKYGIYATYGAKNKTVTCSVGSFQNCYRSIYLAGASLTPQLTGNHIYSYKYDTPDDNFKAYGIYLNGCNQFTVYDNLITKGTAGTNDYTNIGIIVNKSGAHNNLIDGNQISYMERAIQAQGVNYIYDNIISPLHPNIDGLKILCNTITNTKNNQPYSFDIGITSGGIRYEQELSPGYSAGNKFFITTSNVNYFSYGSTNDVLSQIDYNYSTGVSNEEPINYTTPVVNLTTVSNSSCPTHHLTPYTSNDYNKLKSKISNYSTIMDSLNNVIQNTTTPSDEPARWQAHYRFNKTMDENELMRAILNDASIVEKEDTLKDDIIQYHNYQYTGDKDDILAYLYTDKGEYAQADSILNSMDSIPEEENIHKLLQLYKELKYNNKNFEFIAADSSLKYELENIAADTSMDGYQYAISILQKVFGEMYFEPIDGVGEESTRAMLLHTTTVPDANSFIISYPNPVSNEIVFSYKLPNDASSGVIEIYNPVGQKIKTLAVTANQGMVKNNITELSNGLYFYILVVNNTTIARNKFIISK